MGVRGGRKTRPKEVRMRVQDVFCSVGIGLLPPLGERVLVTVTVEVSGEEQERGQWGVWVRLNANKQRARKKESSNRAKINKTNN